MCGYICAVLNRKCYRVYLSSVMQANPNICWNSWHTAVHKIIDKHIFFPAMKKVIGKLMFWKDVWQNIVLLWDKSCHLSIGVRRRMSSWPPVTYYWKICTSHITIYQLDNNIVFKIIRQSSHVFSIKTSNKWITVLTYVIGYTVFVKRWWITIDSLRLSHTISGLC